MQRVLKISDGLSMDPAITDLLSAQADSTRYQISMKVAVKAKSVEEEQGAAIVKMIADAGEGIKKSVRTPSGGLDTYA